MGVVTTGAAVVVVVVVVLLVVVFLVVVGARVTLAVMARLLVVGTPENKVTFYQHIYILRVAFKYKHYFFSVPFRFNVGQQCSVIIFNSTLFLFCLVLHLSFLITLFYVNY